VTPRSDEIYSMLLVGISILCVWGGVAWLVVTLILGK
jgi:hypothetical protein